MKHWNKEVIKEKLETNQNWLEQGILAIFNKQTEDEKRSEQTKHYNNVGFSGCDSRLLTYYAKWLLSGKHLSNHHLKKARKKMLKYAGQLTKIANGKI